MEEVLASHPDVAECAVVGVHDELKGQIPVGFLVLKKGVDRDPHEIVTEVVQMVRQKIGPVAAFRTAVVVPGSAQDAVREGPARHHAEDRRRERLQNSRHDRRFECADRGRKGIK